MFVCLFVCLCVYLFVSAISKTGPTIFTKIAILMESDEKMSFKINLSLKNLGLVVIFWRNYCPILKIALNWAKGKKLGAFNFPFGAFAFKMF